MSNLWPALQILVHSQHPELDSDQEEDSDGRMGIAIGLMSAAINAGTALAGFLVGYWLDSVKTKEEAIWCSRTMTGSR